MSSTTTTTAGAAALTPHSTLHASTLDDAFYESILIDGILGSDDHELRGLQSHEHAATAHYSDLHSDQHFQHQQQLYGQVYPQEYELGQEHDDYQFLGQQDLLGDDYDVEVEGQGGDDEKAEEEEA